METPLCTCNHPAHIFACWGDNGECACREHAVPVQKVDRAFDPDPYTTYEIGSGGEVGLRCSDGKGHQYSRTLSGCCIICGDLAPVQKVDEPLCAVCRKTEAEHHWLSGVINCEVFRLTKPVDDIRESAFTETLKAALSNMLAVAKADEWDKASTGRQIIYRNAEEVLARG